MKALSRLVFAVAILASVFVAGGCIVLPTPPIGFNEIPPEIVARLKSGESTRVDVLLALGDPTQRLENDRYFIYDSRELHWVGALGAPKAVPFALGDTHRLAIEFSGAGKIVRLERFARYSKDTLDKERDAWMKQGAMETAK